MAKQERVGYKETLEHAYLHYICDNPANKLGVVQLTVLFVKSKAFSIGGREGKAIFKLGGFELLHLVI